MPVLNDYLDVVEARQLFHNKYIVQLLFYVEIDH